MAFVKHIGKHGDRKVAIVYREVPGEEHMCLVTYTETLPKGFHDAVINVIESEPGQQATSLSDALFRNLLPDGRPILQTLHREGMIKKVQCDQVVVTPNPQSHVRLDELNKILNGIEKGDEASEKMAELDKNSGFRDPNKAPTEAPVVDAVLTDEQLAEQRVQQAKEMAESANAMLAEAQRLQEEAWELNPELKPKAPAKKKRAPRKKAAAKKKAPAQKATTTAEASADSPAE